MSHFISFISLVEFQFAVKSKKLGLFYGWVIFLIYSAFMKSASVNREIFDMEPIGWITVAWITIRYNGFGKVTSTTVFIMIVFFVQEFFVPIPMETCLRDMLPALR